jgi:hypothetical protein
MDAVFARPENRTPGSVLRHNLGALTLASPGGQHGAEDTCFALPDVLDAPAYMCGASQDLGVFWCARTLCAQRRGGLGKSPQETDFATACGLHAGQHAGLYHAAGRTVWYPRRRGGSHGG